MPTTYKDQFFIIDPGAPPPAGTVAPPPPPATVAAASSDTYESGFYSRRNATGANAAARTVPAMPEVIAAAVGGRTPDSSAAEPGQLEAVNHHIHGTRPRRCASEPESRSHSGPCAGSSALVVRHAPGFGGLLGRVMRRGIDKAERGQRAVASEAGGMPEVWGEMRRLDGSRACIRA